MCRTYKKGVRKGLEYLEQRCPVFYAQRTGRASYIRVTSAFLLWLCFIFLFSAKQEIEADFALGCTTQTQFKNATVREGTTNLESAEFQSISLMCTFTTWLEPNNYFNSVSSTYLS